MDTTPRVAVVIFEGVSLYHLAVPKAVFCDVKPLYQLNYCTEKPGQCMAENGLSVSVEYSLDWLENADIVVIPGWHSQYKRPSDKLLGAVTSAANRGAKIVGLCTGACVPAASGLLVGKVATTHWAFVDSFRYLFPDILVDENAIFIRQDNVYTSAGSSAAVDCCLEVVRQDHGHQIANSIARALVTPSKRVGGQSQYIEYTPTIVHQDKGMEPILSSIRLALQEEHSIDKYAKTLGISRRTFTRHFRAHTGLSFGDWLLQERLRESQYLLETSLMSLDDIARQCGFGASSTFRHHFIQHFSISPNKWRASFAELEGRSTIASISKTAYTT